MNTMRPGESDLEPICLGGEISLGNPALVWALAGPGITAALVGARNATQAEEKGRAPGGGERGVCNQPGFRGAWQIAVRASPYYRQARGESIFYLYSVLIGRAW